ncbi:MAG TPA: hypothetical protein VNG04_05370 [Candidatus Acidoferrum sp.]|nr:hypothetical protein [Candidatus Acidoferrum sp.]
MKKRQIVAQGDLLFIPVDRLPKGAVRRSVQGSRHILAEGEVTGHNHTIVAEKVEVYDAAEAVFAKIMGSVAAPVEHQEHAPTVLDPGVWEVRRQVAYSPDQLPQRVVD